MNLTLDQARSEQQKASGQRQGIRILYVDVAFKYLNPTRGLLPLALLHAGDVHFFGPGYVDGTALENGIERFIEQNGPFDVIVSNEQFVMPWDEGRWPPPSVVQRTYTYSFPNEHLGSMSRIARDFSNLSIPKVVVLLESDYYHWTQSEIRQIDRMDAIVGFGDNLFAFRKELKDLQKEKFAGRATDEWATFVVENKRRIANLPHFIGDDEFDFTPIANRRHSWSVVGTGYIARVEARLALKKHGHRPIEDSPVRRFFSILNRAGFYKRETQFKIELLNRSFRARIARSKYSFTCGSALRMPIRKFFEIPAAGAVLVCSPCNGFDALGFKSMINSIKCEPRDVPDVHQFLENDLERAQSIANEGRKLVMARHSTAARGRQLGDVLAAVTSGRFNGAGWINGEFVLRYPEQQP